MSFEEVKQMTEYMLKIGAMAFEVNGLKVTFDPNARDAMMSQSVTPEMVKQTIQDLVTNSEKQRKEEEEQYLYP